MDDPKAYTRPWTVTLKLEAVVDTELIEAVCADADLSAEIMQTHAAPSVACAGSLQNAISAGIRATGQEHVARMWSKAGHDAMAMAGVTEVGMLFVRCYDGISHHHDEAVSAQDVAAAADAFEVAVRVVAQALT